MKITNLEPASDFEVDRWLEKSLDLTPYQKDKLRKEGIVRFSPYDFYKRRQKEKVSFLWRFTIILFPIYIVALYIFLPFKMIITGKWGYGQKFIDNFHSKWLIKLNLN